MLIMLMAFAVIGLAMPVLPLHVHDRLGFGTVVVGMVSGAQFAASLLSRPWAGMHTDTQGGKKAVVTGLAAASMAGMLYILSLELVARPVLSVTILLAGRGLLGAAESSIITGALGWGLGRVSGQHTGKVIAWVGTAMFASFAAGAPLGSALYAEFGFRAVALATLVAPLLTLLFVLPLEAIAPSGGTRASARQVLKAVRVPGVGLALSCTGFGAIVAFSSLLFTARGWTPVWPVFTCYALAFIAARIFFGHLADRHGGARVAIVFLVVEAVGQGLLGFAPSQTLALLGAALTGFGFSLVYPAFGVEAVRRVPAASRALAMGVYTAFLDLALGIASPVLGWVGGVAGLPSIFMASAVAVLASTAIAAALIVRQPQAHAR
jgi:MFS family permease